MSRIRSIFARISSLFRRSQLEREMEEEMRLHIEMEIERQVANGVEPQRARFEAMKAFGGMEQIKERERRARGLHWLENLCRDFRFGVRMLGRSPGFTSLAVITLALGIGLNTSMFSVLNRMLLRPLPFPEGERLIRVFGVTQESRSWSFSPAYAEDLLSGDDSLSRSGLCVQWSATLTEPGSPPEYLMMLRVSTGFLSTLGVRPLLGRLFTEADDHPESNVVILPYGVWIRLFHGDPEIVGRSVRIDGKAMTVVGVLPESFDYASYIFGPVGVLKPLGLTSWERQDRTQRGFHLVGRLANGATLSDARERLQTASARIASDYPQEHRDQSARVVPLHASGIDETSRDLLLLVIGLSGFVLLIACVNLACLQLVRASKRARENAMRAALGASRLNLIRPLFVESLLLAICGGGAGIYVAALTNRWISAHAALTGGSPLDLPLDGRVLAFSLIVSALTGLVFGVIPGLLSPSVRLNDTIRQDSRGMTESRQSGRLLHALVTGEIAIVFVLLFGAGFFLTGLSRFTSRDPGWNTDGFAYGAVGLPQESYPSGEESVRFYRDLRDRLQELPESQGVAIGWSLPVQAPFVTPRPIVADGREGEPGSNDRIAYFNAVFPGYFDGLQIPLLEGRDFEDFDDSSRRAVAIVNESMAWALWPEGDAIGKRIGGMDARNPDWMEIVGVARDVEYATSAGMPATPFQVYRPFAQEPWGYAHVGVRSSVRAAAAMIEPLRREVAALDGDVAVADASTARDTMRESWANFALMIRLLSVFALLGLLLAAIGIYGVIAQIVTRRTEEFGVRLALGARLGEIVWMVIRMGAKITVVGIFIGLAGSFALGRILYSVSPALSAPQQAIGALVGLSLGITGLLACWLPARRAASIDPAKALRSG